MDKLNYFCYKLVTKSHFLIICSIILISSCQKYNDQNQTYLGKLNTLREYETTMWKYEVNSILPFIKVPSSLYKKLSYDSTFISEGLVVNSLTTETVIPYDISWKWISNPDLIKSVLFISSEGQQYNLEDNLRNIINNIDYYRTIVGGVTGLWLEDYQKLCLVFNDSTKYTILAKPLHVGDEWIRESRRYKNSNGIYELFQQECKVLALEHVVVKAGEFSAYKIEVMNHWVDLNSKSVRVYEYYVPDIGLVLQETDGITSQASIPPFGDASISTFHQKERKELVNYSFIKY